MVRSCSSSGSLASMHLIMSCRFSDSMICCRTGGSARRCSAEEEERTRETKRIAVGWSRTAED